MGLLDGGVATKRVTSDGRRGELSLELGGGAGSGGGGGARVADSQSVPYASWPQARVCPMSSQSPPCPMQRSVLATCDLCC